jgi:hypothetical protein
VELEREEEEMKRMDTMTGDELHKYTTVVYEELAQATENYLNAKYALGLDKRNLEDAMSRAIFNREIVGKNEQEREGQALEMFSEHYRNVNEAEGVFHEAEVRLQHARIEEGYLTTTVKIMSSILSGDNTHQM